MSCQSNCEPGVPQGVVAIVTNSGGDVVATAANFDTDTPGGFTLLESQQRRAEAEVSACVIRAGCSQWLAEPIIRAGRAPEMLRLAIKAGELRLVTTTVGHPEPEQAHTRHP